MSAIEDSGDAVRRAAWIAGRSRIATVADFIVDRSVASVRSSRALAFVRLRLGEFQSLPPGERTRCALIALGAALAGHIVLASMLPVPARPTLGLTAVALLGAALVTARSTK
jgi:hypothetical protein